MSDPVTINAQVLGVERVRVQLQEINAAARARLRGKVQRLGLELLGKVKEQLTGKALRVQTGRLRRSINERTTVAGDDVTSTVGTNVVYGRFWELGFNGVEQVRAHMRRVKSRDVKEVEHYRKWSGVGDGETFKWAKRTKTIAHGVGLVRAHSRRVNARPRPFLTPALAEIRDRVLDELSKDLTDGT